MNRILKTGIVAVLSIIIVAGMVACSGGTVTKTVTPTDYDNTRASLADAQKTIIALQQQIQSLQNQNSDLQAQVTDQSNNAAGLQKQYDALNTQFQQLTVQETQDQATITSLRTLYQAMKAAQDLAAAEAANVTAANIETAMFAAINNIRAQAGLAVLKPGTNTRVAAVNNSQNMATHKDIVTLYNPYQEEFIAAGYDSVDSLVNAAIAIWKSNDYWYQLNILPAAAVYGAVAAYEDGGIFYITYIASNFP